MAFSTSFVKGEQATREGRKVLHVSPGWMLWVMNYPYKDMERKLLKLRQQSFSFVCADMTRPHHLPPCKD